MFKIRLTLMLAAVFITSACSRAVNTPMKPYAKVDIPDGEFLHYAIYSSGEKTVDEYFVTRIETNGSGGFNYRIYEDLIPVKSRRKLSPVYTGWPVFMLVDPSRASALETGGNLKGSELEDFASTGVKGIVYWNYRLFPDEGQVRYVSRSVTNDITSTRTSTLKVRPGYPSADAFSKNFISYRLLDPGKKGVMFWIVPFFIKDPVPVTLSRGREETVTVKAGTFRATRVETTLSDPFLDKLVGKMMKEAEWMVETSDRRLPVKAGGMGMDIELEEISNVK